MQPQHWLSEMVTSVAGTFMGILHRGQPRDGQKSGLSSIEQMWSLRLEGL